MDRKHASFNIQITIFFSTRLGFRKVYLEDVDNLSFTSLADDFLIVMEHSNLFVYTCVSNHKLRKINNSGHANINGLNNTKPGVERLLFFASQLQFIIV